MTTVNFIYPGQSDIQFQTVLFPDGQPHIKFDVKSLEATDMRAPLRILARIASSSDLLLVLLAKNTLDYQGFEHVELHISYLMAARMDRVMQDGEPFSLKVIANVINAANFKKVFIFDPHSEVATAVIERSYPVVNHQYVHDAVTDYVNTHQPAQYCLVSPDAGALKKIHKLAQYMDVSHVVECSKERDLKTGALSGFKTTTTNLAGTTCFIIDDICDGGGTFAGTAAMLRALGAAKIVLVVSHGIFSKGTTIAGVDEIYTTDSYKHLDGVNLFAVSRYM